MIKTMLVSCFYGIVLCVLSNSSSFSQKKKDVYVDKEGVMRWGDTKEEVYGFGVNYTANFAHAYRVAKKLNVDLEQAIEDDVYHFARLGFDAFRVHVWDTEISDTVGNLIENEKLRLFDFLLTKLKERGIKIFITPIAFWGNGYPEDDEKTPGFSFKYGKEACLVNPDAIKAQENYLFQFLNHVNPYTKIAYKNDPDIVGFEVSNEPHHKGTPADVKKYINRMVASMRRTGCKKPVLYNVSHSIHLSDAYYDANIDGGTFQWYPTGLGANHELRGNFLPNVDVYDIPFAHDQKFRSKAKIVYEFDAADVGRSYIYPAMARSFRKAGIQWATHFAYDPTYFAFANTEYNTHYMNLVYAPQKAIGLKIAGEVFHAVPLNKDYGKYPDNTSFGDFQVSYENDLAQLNNGMKFFYSNHTDSKPKKPTLLEEICGWGNSPIVKYEGTGAYFLDKLEPGVWRLEVLPDAIWVDNIFGRNDLEKQVAVVKWNQWPMKVNIPDLTDNFSIQAINSDLKDNQAKSQTFNVTPGVYMLTRHGITPAIQPSSKWKNIAVNEFAAPKSNLNKDVVLHQPLKSITNGKALMIEATILTQKSVEKADLFIENGVKSMVVPMERKSGYQYVATIPPDFIQLGYVSYFISVTTQEKTITAYPSRQQGIRSKWSYGVESPYTVPVLADTSDLYLFNAVTDAIEVSKEWRPQSLTVPLAPNDALMIIGIDKLFRMDEENPNAPAVNDYSWRYNFKPNVAGKKDELSNCSRLIMKAQSSRTGLPIQVALVDDRGNAYGAIVNLDHTGLKDYSVALTKFSPVKLVNLPRPYPSFLPYFFNSEKIPSMDLSSIETIQISVGPGLNSTPVKFSVAVESIRLAK